MLRGYHWIKIDVRLCVTVSFILLLTVGCAHSDKHDKSTVVQLKPQLMLNPHSLQRVSVPDVASIFQLNQQQEQAFLTFFHADENAHLPPNERLFDYLERVIDGFHFRGDT